MTFVMALVAHVVAAGLRSSGICLPRQEWYMQEGI